MRLLLFIFILFFQIDFKDCFAQNWLNVNQTISFVNYLSANNRFDDALNVLSDHQKILQPDTFNFYKAYVFYELRKPDTASCYFDKIDKKSPLFFKSQFFNSLNLAYSRKINLSKQKINLINTDTLFYYKQLVNTVNAGISLLERDYQKFDSISSLFLKSDYRLQNEQERLVEMKKEIIMANKKSPTIAGLLSAVVPGLGKFYAGKKGASLSAFGVNVFLAAATFESYYRTKSIKNPQVLIFGTLFSFFYVGNIMGSVFSVKQQIRSVNGKYNNEILASIHYPILNFFK